MIDKDYLVGVFNNILPATFQDSVTYLEQLILLRDKVNEIIEIINGFIEGGSTDYVLPTASATVKGGVKIGERLTIDENGVLSADEQGGGGGSYDLPIASEQVLGGIKVGQNLTIEEDGTLNAQAGGGGESYTLPVATEQVLGGVKIGENLHITEDGVLSAVGGGGSYTLPVATPNILGGIKIGARLSIDNQGVLSADIQNGGEGGTLSPATETVLGGVKIPVAVDGKANILHIDANGNLAIIPTNSISMNINGATGFWEIGVNPATETDLGGVIMSRFGFDNTNGFISLKLGNGLYFDEDGRLCASGGGGAVSAGLVDEISMETTQQEGSGITETLAVGDSVKITKF